MRLTELARARLPLAIHEVRYDRLVSDFEETVRGFAAFVGLEWTDAFRSFDRTAQTRGVRTASATQVRKGLYDGPRPVAPLRPTAGAGPADPGALGGAVRLRTLSKEKGGGPKPTPPPEFVQSRLRT
jgi:hypothetical protein